MAPEASEAADGVFGPVRLVSEAAARALYGRGRRVRVLSSYSVPVGQGSAELHSLADVVEFVCAQCLEWCQATLVAIRRRHLVCPGCFGAQPRAVVPEPVSESAVPSPAASESVPSEHVTSESVAAESVASEPVVPEPVVPEPVASGSSGPEPVASQRAAAPTALSGPRRAPWSVHAARSCRRERAG
ncbi:hypothetical protein LY12_001669 [Prauserella alba]|nr:hypothetical protein [Prauserella alba]